MNRTSLEIALKFTEKFQAQYPVRDLHELTEELANEIEQVIFMDDLQITELAVKIAIELQLQGEPKNITALEKTIANYIESLPVDCRVVKQVSVEPEVKHAKNVKDYEWLDNELETILFEMQDGNATKEETKNKLFEYIFEDLVNEIQKLKDSSLSV